MTVRRVKIADAMALLSSMLQRNIFFTDIIFKDEQHIYFKASKLPSKDEYTGDQILNNINFDDTETD